MRIRPVAILSAAVAALSLGLTMFSAQAEVVPVGPGSYLIGPNTAKGDPVRGPNFKGPIPTQMWFSNVAFKGKGSNNMFAHPLAMKPGGNGLGIHYNGAYMRASNGGFAAPMPKTNPDITLGATAGSSFADVGLDGYSDWFIKVFFGENGKGMHVSYGHGSPFVYATYDSGGAQITTGGNAEVWSKEGNVLGITVGSANYALFAPTGTQWQVDGKTISNQGAAGKNYFSVAALPDKSPETLALFKKYAFSHVTDTQVEWKFEAGNMNVTYKFITKAYEGSETGTVTALLPHQWKYTNEKLSPLTKLTYQNPRGVMKVSAGPSFTTSTPIQGILPALPAAGIKDKERMAGYLKQLPAAGGGPRDTYWEGKQLGKMATFAGIADQMGDNGTRDQMIDGLKKKLESWFTAAEGKNRGVFTYNTKWGILVGLGGSYGSDWPFNDHHFHYGYFIRAAAEVARFDAEWAKKWSPFINLLIREIASMDRNDPLFPHSRCFDRYEGHGWASGDAGFERGNNNESSSESMNAWYGIAMWGAATGDDKMRDYGLYMYTTDMTTIEEYWFDVSDTNFPKEYQRECVGMVWGDGGAWATWFSGDADCIHGIQYLPFTPGSMYLIRYPEYVNRAYDSLMKVRNSKDNLNAGWGDLVVMFGAGANPARSAEFVDSTPQMKVEDGNTRAMMYHWVHTLDSLGTIDRSVTGDYPLYNVYNKGGKKTYAVYNYTDKPLTVKFSDGKVVNAAKKGMTVAN